ncbi:MAG TPA: DUF1573 domain-containing protein [Candidatus Polarisedimenticolaceae bacterium]|nr:DUF1573 domain-containing protein [Candidatus Polarisedimenticolaceae bacterium]
MRAALAVAAIVLLAGAPRADDVAPHIAFDVTDVNAGDVIRGTDAVAVFTYRNTGTAPLHITAAKPACGCTVATFDAEVAPGATGKLKAEVHTVDYKGPIGKEITVHHDDAAQGPIMLTVRANVVGSLEIYPTPSLTIGPRMNGYGKPAYVLLRKDDTESGVFALTALSASVPWLAVSARKVTQAEPPADWLPAAHPGDYIVSIQTKKPPLGFSQQKVTFKTGLAREPVYTIPITVHVRAPADLNPESLVLQPVPDAPGTATGAIVGSVRDDLDPAAVRVRSDDPAFVPKIEHPGERAFRLLVDWKASGHAGPAKTTVHIDVGDETVDVPVSVR